MSTEPRSTLSITLALLSPRLRLSPLAGQVAQDYCLASGKLPIGRSFPLRESLRFRFLQDGGLVILRFAAYRPPEICSCVGSVPPQSLLPERSFDGSVALIPAVGRLDFLSLLL